MTGLGNSENDEYRRDEEYRIKRLPRVIRRINEPMGVG